MAESEPSRLRRQLGLGGAVMMGLGAMVGTGVFVSLGIGAGIAGSAVLLAVALAAAVALCNGLSSAQLAASHPVSGGTYEYGYKYLNSWLGFAAGWTFLLAKSASAASAALGFAAYLLHAFGASTSLIVPLALAAVAVLAIVVLGGMRQSSTVNIAIVSITLAALLFFVVAGLPGVAIEHFAPSTARADNPAGVVGPVLQATALMFVAYTGYARIATLGEEVHEPQRTIPRAIVMAMIAALVLYVAVAAVGLGTLGAEAFARATSAEIAPLAVAAQTFAAPFSSQIVTAGAITAMLGVLLNLVLGLSRMLLAMGRRRDMPALFERLNEAKTTPYWSVVAVAAGIAGLVLIGDVKTTWSFSAFTVLIYYAITNLAALRMPAGERRFPRWIAALGLAACLLLAFWVERETWVVGLAMIAVGFIWHAIARTRRKAS